MNMFRTTGLSLLILVCLAQTSPLACAALTHNGDTKEAADLAGLVATDTEIAPATTIREFFGTTLSLLDNLHYHSAKSIELRLPQAFGVDHVVIISWGFAGSGNLFSELPGARIKTKVYQDTSDASSALTFGELAKLFMQNKLAQKSKELPFLQWIVDTKSSPLSVFGIKLALLIKELSQTHDISKFSNEVARLLFRLSLVDNLKLITSDKALSSFLPEAITSLIKATWPEMLETIDSLWKSLTDTKLELINKNISVDDRQVYAYVFKNMQAAQAFHSAFASYNGTMFSHDAEQYIERNGLDQITLSELIKLGKDELIGRATNPMQAALLAQFGFGKLVAVFDYRVAAHTHKLSTISDEEEIVRSALFNDGNLVDGITKITQLPSGDYAIGYVSTELSLADTMRFLVFTALTVFKEQALAINQHFKKNPTEEAAYTQKLEKHANEQHKIALFKKSAAGQASTKRLAEKMKDLHKNQTPSDIEQQQAMADAIKVARAKQEALKGDATAKQTLIVQLTTFQAKSPEASRADIQKSIDDQTKALKAINDQIAALDRDIAELSGKKNAIHAQDENVVVKLQESLARMEKIIKKLTDQGDQVPATMLAKVATLKAQIKAHGTVTTKKISTAECIALREKRAAALEEEARVIGAELEASRIACQAITDPNEREDASIELEYLKSPRFQAYIKSLTALAVQIKEENKKAHDLEQMRKVASRLGSDFPTEKQVELAELEAEVGFILAGREERSFLGDLIANNPEIKMLKGKVKLSPETLKTLKYVLKNSTSIQSYQPIYRRVISRFFPELLLTFEQLVSASE